MAVPALGAGDPPGRDDHPKRPTPGRDRPTLVSARPRQGAAAADLSRPAAASLGEAGGLYRRYCLRCHEADGSGQETRMKMPQIPDFRDRDWHQARSDFELTASIQDGKGTRMPAFSDRLDERRIQDLVAYVRSLGPEERRRDRREFVAGDKDFETRFRQLRQELADLQRQFSELQEKVSSR